MSLDPENGSVPTFVHPEAYESDGRPIERRIIPISDNVSDTLTEGTGISNLLEPSASAQSSTRRRLLSTSIVEASQIVRTLRRHPALAQDDRSVSTENTGVLQRNSSANEEEVKEPEASQPLQSIDSSHRPSILTSSEFLC